MDHLISRGGSGHYSIFFFAIINCYQVIGMDLKTPLSKVAGIGPTLSYKLKKLNLISIQDLIYHFPFRYDDFSQSVTLKDAQINQIVTLQGEIWSIKNVYTRSKKILTQAIFNDGTSPLELTWFNQSWLTKQIMVGDKLQISGKLTRYKNKLSMIAPKWEKIHNDNLSTNFQPLHTGKLVPIYPETQGLTSKWLRTKISSLLLPVLRNIEDPLPNFIRGNLLPLSEAILQIHMPKDWQEVKKSRERLGFDELFYISLATQKTKLEWHKKPSVKPLNIYESDIQNLIQTLPFNLTDAQKRVIGEIKQDLQKIFPMNRLIQGEVGSGKTVVATIIAYLIFKNGLRTLFMAPTEILAFQHFKTVSQLLEPLGVRIGIYTGSKKTADTNSHIMIGTHALLSDKLITKDIGLIIVDEQQRFGVKQRTWLRQKAKIPHFLTMTATPIPRTVALTLYGDLDISIIDEIPKERQTVKTFVVPEKKRTDAYKFIQKKLDEGDQVYIITPLIEISETLVSVKAATAEFEKLKRLFPKNKIDLLHGRMSGKEKEAVIQKFQSNTTNILVSTSVVEVGMDNPNATVIVIEGAERFGLSQLHQLRGRVGRGHKQSFCLLFTSSDSMDQKRLKYLEKTFNGLELAEQDLKIRGSGEIFGIKQSGRFELKIASFSDFTLVQHTKKAAASLLALDPTLDKHPILKAKLESLTTIVMPD